MKKEIKNIRTISFEIIYFVVYKNQLLNNVQEKYFDNNILSTVDKSFIHKECFGVLENKNEIDFIISKYIKIPLNKLKKNILIALELAIYELIYMDKIPSYATIYEYVEIVKTKENKFLSGFTNAVLRNVLNDLDNIKNEIEKNVEKNCYFRICDNNVLIELDENKIYYEKYDGDFDFKFVKVYKTKKYSDILKLKNFKNGNIIIQDVSSMYLTDTLAYFLKKQYDTNNAKIDILDVCAAPGGKIIGLIDIIKNDFDIFAIARDKNKYKIEKIEENKNRLNIKCLSTEIYDATIYNSYDFEKYNLVIADVPCSNVGVINRKPDVMLHRTRNTKSFDITDLINIQKKIINTVSKYVKINGLLSYSTCSTNAIENEKQIENFLKEHINFKIMKQMQIKIGDKMQTDGFYFCILKKLEK